MENENKSRKLIQTGAETFGAAIGGAIGLIGGPLGAIGGSITGILLSKGLSEFADRFLSNREQARVGASAGLTIIGVQENIDRGLTLRQDGFFDYDEINRSKAEELFEGILIKCKNEFEEKKIKFISNIYKNVAFDSSVNPDNANQILNSVQQFSYRQLTILAFVGQNSNNKFSLRVNDFRDDYETISTEIEFLLQDFILLDKQGIISRSDNTSMLDTSDVVPGLMKLTQIGLNYFQLLDLNTMSGGDFYFLEQLKQ
jgi:hypothetical protein